MTILNSFLRPPLTFSDFLRLLCFTFCLLPTSLHAQKANEALEKSKKFYADLKYDKAKQFADEALALDSTLAEAHFQKAKLCEVYREPIESIKYYEKAVQLAPTNTTFAVAYQRLIGYHLQAGNYAKTKQLLEQYIPMLRPTSSVQKLAKRQLEICNYAEKAIAKPLKVSIEALTDTVNKFGMQYFPCPTADNETLLFTAQKDEGDEDLFVTTFENEKWQKPISISDKINTADNEGAGTISADGRTLVFTACNRRDGSGGCDLYISYKNDKEWSKPKNLGPTINTYNWEGQPSLSSDGRVLYFASDRAGGAGGRDIWYSVLNPNKQWTAAKNLGNVVNTLYDEASPFIHANGRTLVFSSEGHDNFGGYDLFWTDSTVTGWRQPENLGYPINTPDNQVALAITSDGQYGYYSIDAKHIGNQRVSKIYRFILPDELRKKLIVASYLKGTITDAVSKKPVKADIELIDLKTNQVATKFESDAANGFYTTVIPSGGDWGLYVSANGYFYKSLAFDFSQKNKAENKILDITLEPLNASGVGVLNNIYFETNKADLQEKSRTELEKLTQLLKNQPLINIEVAGHTDDVGDAKQNMALSQLRANNVVSYLVKAGIDKSRIKAVGFGKTRPRVPNTNDENRQLNRRIEWRLWQKN